MEQHADTAIRKRLTQIFRGLLPDAILAAGVIPFTPLAPSLDDRQLQDWVLHHHAQYGLDPFWILTGKGDPPQMDQTRPQTVPVFTMHAVHPQTSRWLPQIIESVVLDPAVFSRDRFVVRMEDRAMEPQIRQGAYLVVDTAQRTLPELATPAPHIFAVDVPDEGLLARFAFRNPETKRVKVCGRAATAPALYLPDEQLADRVLGRIVWVAQPL